MFMKIVFTKISIIVCGTTMKNYNGILVYAFSYLQLKIKTYQQYVVTRQQENFGVLVTTPYVPMKAHL